MRGFVKILQARPVFAINPEIGMQLLSSAIAVMQREEGFTPEMFHVTGAVSRMERLSYSSEPQGETQHNIYVLPVHGTMLAEDQICGPAGMLTQARLIRAAANSPDVHGILLDIMSPGGMVLGGNEIEAAVRYARTKKPVLAYVNGMACSMAYSLAMQADHIMLNGNQAEVGSIGVTIHYLDFTEKLRKEGIVEVKILSSLSPDKNKFNFSAPSDQDIELIQSEQLDPIAQEFRNAVKRQRPQVKDDALTGNCYFASQAIEMGLADEIGTWENAMSWMADAISSENQSENQQPENDMGIFQKKKDKSEEATAEVSSRELSLEEIQAEHQQEVKQLQASLDASYAEKESLSAQLKNLKRELATQAEQLKDLSALVNQQAEIMVRMKAAPVNQVADADGDEGAPSADADAQVSAAPAWAGPWDEKLKTLAQE
jgi:protease-4